MISEKPTGPEIQTQALETVKDCLKERHSPECLAFIITELTISLTNNQSDPDVEISRLIGVSCLNREEGSAIFFLKALRLAYNIRPNATPNLRFIERIERLYATYGSGRDDTEVVKPPLRRVAFWCAEQAVDLWTADITESSQVAWRFIATLYDVIPSEVDTLLRQKMADFASFTPNAIRAWAQKTNRSIPTHLARRLKMSWADKLPDTYLVRTGKRKQ